jgi:CheY-like chemotaxis protein
MSEGKAFCASATAWPHCVRVLIVDDDVDYRLVVRGVLEAVGYQALEASNGQEGLRLCRVERPSIVLLDAVMPVMDGTAFLHRKRRDRDICEIPVVMLTAWNVESEIGVASILRKPVNGRAIVCAVRSFAKLHTSRRSSG